MIVIHTPSIPRAKAPSAPFIKIGQKRIVQFDHEHIEYQYSDSPIHDLLKGDLCLRLGFQLSENLCPVVQRNGVNYHIRLHEKLGNNHIECRLVPSFPRNGQVAVGNRIILTANEYREAVADQVHKIYFSK